MTTSPARTSTARPGRARLLVRHTAATLVLAAGTLLPAATSSAAADEVPAAPDGVAAAVDRYLTSQLEAASIPGAAVAITHGSQVVHVAGFGHDATGAPVTADTSFRIASLSKSFTALAVLQLVDDGRLSLDDPVVAHLPEFHLADPRGADITVRQLLNQTSGMADSEVHDISRRQPATLAEAVTSLHSARLATAPGTRWSYHNPNYQVAARLVEVVSGVPFARYLRTRVLEPAGMTSSRTVHTDDQPVPGLADGHVVAYGHAFSLPAPATFDEGDGGVVSTAADLANWLVVQSNDGRAPDGTRIISSRGLDQMRTPGSEYGYALGWDTDGPADAPTRLDHTGNLLTYTAFEAVLPETGYGVAVLLNSGSGLMLDQTRIFDGVLDIVEGADDTTTGPADATFSATTLDTILALLSLAVLVLGTRGVLRARRWASRHHGRRIVLVVRTLPHLAVITTAALFPRLTGLLVGRDVNWETSAYGWPALAAFLLAVIVATVAALAARAWHLRSGARRTAAPAGRAGGRNRS